MHGIEHDEAMAAIAHAKGIDVETTRFEDWIPTGDYARRVRGTSLALARSRKLVRPRRRRALARWTTRCSGTDPRPSPARWVPTSTRSTNSSPELVDGSTTWHLEQWGDRLDESGRFESADRQSFRWIERYSADEYTSADADALEPSHASRPQREALHTAIHGVVVAHGGAVDVTYRADLFLKSAILAPTAGWILAARAAGAAVAISVNRSVPITAPRC